VTFLLTPSRQLPANRKVTLALPSGGFFSFTYETFPHENITLLHFFNRKLKNDTFGVVSLFFRMSDLWNTLVQKTFRLNEDEPTGN
jgi:hypothetical protein